MNAIENSPVNEWNHYDDYPALPLLNSAETVEDWRNRMSTQIFPAPNLSVHDQLPDRATHLLMEK